MLRHIVVCDDDDDPHITHSDLLIASTYSQQASSLGDFWGRRWNNTGESY